MLLKKDTKGSNKKIKVVVAMSGGVDSSVAAALLKQAGFDVVGIMLKFWSDQSTSCIVTDKKDGNRCCSPESEKLARLVAKKIGIPFYIINVEKEFKKKVVDYFLAEYKAGRTPNPCVVCNKEIKFGFLINKALSLGADFVASGHYARTSTNNKSVRMNEFVNSGKIRYSLMRAKSAEKDQSYFLWQLNQKQLGHVLFPVGGYTKPEVRKLAKKFNLPTAETPESQEVCFISGQTNDFLKKYLKIKLGKIIDIKGKTLGQHNGLWFYTIGQRKGLELQQGPWYVAGKDFRKNILVVSKNIKDLNFKDLTAKNVNWIAPQKFPLNAEVKIRYKSKLAKAKIFKLPGVRVKVVFQKPQKAITPGQSAVFYRKSELLGGGVIE